MARLSLTTPPDARSLDGARRATERDAPRTGELLVVSFGNPAAVDYVAYVTGQTHSPSPEYDSTPLIAGKGEGTRVEDPEVAATLGANGSTLLADDSMRRSVAAPVRFHSIDQVSVADVRSVGGGTVVLFLGPQLSERYSRALSNLVALLAKSPPRFVCVVGSFRVHLNDQEASDAEAHVVGKLRTLGANIVVFRAGHILSAHSTPTDQLRQWGAFYPLVPKRVRGCCIAGERLFAAIEAERSEMPARRTRRLKTFTLPGPNRPWRDWLADNRRAGIVSKAGTGISTLLSFLCVGNFIAYLRSFLTTSRASASQWYFYTLLPGSFRELRALYNKYSHADLKLVGYNNGVNHFGHHFPGQTVVSTVRVNRVVRQGAEQMRADAGATIHKARQFLAESNQDMYVVPNYSYVSLGTAFFVPIHGSATDYSCVADTITKAIFYDPVADQLINATRDMPEFRDHVYEPDSKIMLLRLYLRVNPKTRFYMQKQALENALAADLLAELSDSRAANVEVRKGRATDTVAHVLKFYKESADAGVPGLELPRDQLGRLWDKLEENPLTSYLMHALGRHILWHIELFFTAEEFTKFWETHGTAPLKKMQFRYLRRDGLPRSPFRDSDCVSVDTFTMRWKRKELESYLSRTFGTVKLNPGKHSK